MNTLSAICVSLVKHVLSYFANCGCYLKTRMLSIIQLTHQCF